MSLVDSNYASDSSAWDTITGFDGSDKIDLAELTFTGALVNFAGIFDKGDSLNFSELTSSGFFANAGTDYSIAVGSDGTNAMIFVDLNGNGDLDNDLAIIISGHSNANAIMQTEDYVLV